MRGAGYADVPVVLQVPGNKADAVPCERLHNENGKVALSKALPLTLRWQPKLSDCRACRIYKEDNSFAIVGYAELCLTKVDAVRSASKEGF